MCGACGRRVGTHHANVALQDGGEWVEGSGALVVCLSQVQALLAVPHGTQAIHGGIVARIVAQCGAEAVCGTVHVTQRQVLVSRQRVCVGVAWRARHRQGEVLGGGGVVRAQGVGIGNDHRRDGGIAVFLGQRLRQRS